MAPHPWVMGGACEDSAVTQAQSDRRDPDGMAEASLGQAVPEASISGHQARPQRAPSIVWNSRPGPLASHTHPGLPELVVGARRATPSPKPPLKWHARWSRCPPPTRRQPRALLPRLPPPSASATSLPRPGAVGWARREPPALTEAMSAPLSLACLWARPAWCLPQSGASPGATQVSVPCTAGLSNSRSCTCTPVQQWSPARVPCGDRACLSLCWEWWNLGTALQSASGSLAKPEPGFCLHPRFLLQELWPERPGPLGSGPVSLSPYFCSLGDGEQT